MIMPIIVKHAGTDSEEPTQREHPSSPAQSLRPRSEAIIYDKSGVLAIKKPGYLLMPGGGIPDGETPEASVVREALEEADAIIKNVDKLDVIETVYDLDNIISEGWDGERTHFFTAIYGGSGRMNHPDREGFKFIPYDEAIDFLQELIDDPKQSWAKANNIVRQTAIIKARDLVSDPAILAFKKYAGYLRECRNSRKRPYTIDYIRRYS